MSCFELSVPSLIVITKRLIVLEIVKQSVANIAKLTGRITLTAAPPPLIECDGAL